MAFLTDKKFDFVSHALPKDTFGVVNFKGSEGFSKCYEFEITLVATDPEIDLDKVLQNPVTFTILREDGDIPFHGILAQFDQLHAVDEYVFYRAVLVPKLWWLSLTHHNQVFLDKTVPEIIEAVLKDGGLTTLDFELRLENNYPHWEYICQYRESHLSFVSRWLEREGMYYFFEQTDTGEKMIITDTKVSHTDMPQGKTMHYSPPSGLDEVHREEVIKAFVCRQRMLPQNLRLKDYNYRTPSLEISGNAQVKENGKGDVYIYGEHFRTPEEGNTLAKVRAEELLCQEKRFFGESTIPFLRPGYLFNLQDHYRDSFNQTYLTVELEHEGSQAAFLLAGAQKGLSEVEEQPYYRNSFVDIPGDVQFRPHRKTEKARLYGTMNAKIDAAESGQYAELDAHGRYKVILPFDLSGRKDGKASAWLRKMQPYGGADHGMHFPLHKGTEVLLTFIDGDPDRPIIAGAVPNPEYPSQVTSEDQTMSKITTSGGNKIHIEDNEGKQRILLHSPVHNTFLRMGSPGDPPDTGGTAGGTPSGTSAGSSEDESGFTDDQKKEIKELAKEEDKEQSKELAKEQKEQIEKEAGEWGASLVSEKGIKIQAGGKNEIILGEETKMVVGGSVETVIILDNKFVLGNALEVITGFVEDVILGLEIEFKPLQVGYSQNEAHVKGEIAKVEGSVERLTANQTVLITETTNLKGNVTDLKTQVEEVNGDIDALNLEVNRLDTARNDLRADAQQVFANAGMVVAAMARAIGELQQAMGVGTRAAGEWTETTGEVNRIEGETNNVSGEMNTVTTLALIV